MSYPFRSVQCTLVDCLKSFFVAYMDLHVSYFEVELKVQSTLFCFSVNSKLGTRLNYFCTGFCHSDCFPPSYRSCFVAVTLFSTTSQLLNSEDFTGMVKAVCARVSLRQRNHSDNVCNETGLNGINYSLRRSLANHSRGF